jgi:hypothetical protein
MSLELQTVGTTGEVIRVAAFSHNAAYTVLFNVYFPSAMSFDFVYGVGGTTSSNGGTSLGSLQDSIKTNGASTSIKLVASGSETIPNYLPGTGWHKLAIIRSSTTAVKMRYNGTNTATITNDVSARESTLTEAFFRYDSGPDSARAGVRVTNYKCWSAALSDAEVDAEHATTSFIVTANKVTGSPMGDISVLSNNLTADGAGNVWTAGAGIIAGANDPAVNYGASPAPPKMGRRIYIMP